MNQQEVAKILGRSQSRISSFEKGENIPDIETLMRLCDIYSTDVGTILSSGYQAQGPASSANKEQADIDLIMVRMVEAVLSAGHGSFETSAEGERKYAFRSDFLRRKGNVAEMVLMRVDGDSMEPLICSGDVVLIDQSQRTLRPGQLYAVGIEDMVFLKYVFAEPGKIILRSRNEKYPPLIFDTRGDLEDSVRIAGRCVWSCREL
jgi:phage repressor protein C with HTH and peptisase S24 domain